MADHEETANVIAGETEEIVISPPSRSIAGGEASSRGGVIRSGVGGVTEELGGTRRQVARAAPAKEENDDAEKPDDDAAAGALAAGGVEGAGEDVAAQDGAADDGKDGEQGEAGGEGRTAAQQAALEALPPEVQTALEPFNAELQESGTLSAESVTKLAADLKAPEYLVKFHLDTIAALGTPAAAAEADPIQAEIVSAAYETAGGKEAYAPFRKWLDDEGRTEDVAALTDAVESGKPNLVKRLMAPLVAEFKESGAGADGRRDLVAEGGNGSSEPAVEGFGSREEQNAALREKDSRGKLKYETDPVYRGQVDRRLLASRWSTGG